ncbi:MAG: hypothetical protein ACK5JH_06965 [Anaerocolumna sp.]
MKKLSQNEIAKNQIQEKVELSTRLLNEILERYGKKSSEDPIIPIHDPEYWIKSKDTILNSLDFVVELLYTIDDDTVGLS